MLRYTFIITVLNMIINIAFGQVKYDYLGNTVPDSIPLLFAPDIVSTQGNNEHTLSISPDGNEIYFTREPERRTYVIKKNGTEWSTPQLTSFIGREAIFSPDGSKLFFNNGDLLYVNINSIETLDPIWLNKKLNTSSHEYYATISRNGNMYFSRIDTNYAYIYRAEQYDNKYTNVRRLPKEINKPNCNNFHSFISPDEDYVLFNSNRNESENGVDIYISFKDNNGNWTEAVSIGNNINSGIHDLCPTVSPDGKYLFFTRYNHSAKNGDVYWVSADFINELKTIALGGNSKI